MGIGSRFSVVGRENHDIGVYDGGDAGDGAGDSGF